MTAPESPDSAASPATDEAALRIIRNYSLAATGALVAIPVPGVDLAVTYGVWGKMIYELSHLYGEELSAQDARHLAADLFKSVILSAVAWFASAKTASTILKFIPGAGTVVAYLIDALIAGFGAKKITSALGFVAAAYYKSGKKVEAKEFVDEVKQILKDPKMLAALLAAVSPVFRRRPPSL